MAFDPEPGDVVRIRGARWRVAHRTRYDGATVIEVRGCDRENHGEPAHFLLPFEPAEPQPYPSRPLVVSPRRWRRVARGVLATASPAWDAVDTAIAADFEVLPFQLEPALAVARGVGTRLLIADEVGLGKTVQAGLVLAEVLRRCPGDGRVLVVCPAGLREQWELELRQRFHLEPTILDAAALVGTAALAHGPNPWASRRIVITSIDYVKRPEVMRSLEALVWDAVVFDEAHALSGQSDRRMAAATLADRSRIVMLLTATPHSGDDDAFARLCAIGELDDGFPLVMFRRTRADVGLASPRRTRWTAILLTAAERRMHAALEDYARRVWSEGGKAAPGARLTMAVLMRRGCSSAASLARSVERRLALLSVPDSGGEQLGLPFAAGAGDDEPAAQLGSPGLADPHLERTLLEELLSLAHAAAANESKARRLSRLLARVREPAIVFTEYRDTLVQLQSVLAPFAPTVLHGGLAPAERRRAVRRFTEGSAGLLLATDAASEGLNLHQRCRLVINLELPWTPLRLEQRIGRVERIGQQRRVHAIHLIAAGTSEETTVALLCRRMERASRVLEALRQPDPHGIAILQSIVDGTDWQPGIAHSAAPGPTCVGVPDVRSAAVAEAQRIVRSRRMAAASEEPPHRPPVAIVRRPGGPGQGWWAFRTVYVDARDRRAWETIHGIGGRLVSLPARSASDAQRWFTEGWEALSQRLDDGEAIAAAGLRTSLEPSVALAIRREIAIRTGLTGRRARMAADLVQPGLFDGRSERAAAAQAAVVAEALARCERRLLELSAARSVTVSRRDLVFAVVLA